MGRQGCDFEARPQASVACCGTLLYTYRRLLAGGRGGSVSVQTCAVREHFCLRDVVGGGWFVWAGGLC